MRKLNLLPVLLATVVASTALAQLNAREIFCEMCRDPLRYPDDWANFAFNQVYGDKAWLDFDEADDFFLVNRRGDRVYVDVDYVMKGINVFGKELPLWPKNKLQIELALPNGRIVTYLRSIFMYPLPVPSGSDTGTGSDNTSSGDGSGGHGGEGDDDYDTEDDYNHPEVEPNGIVDVVDPDENGEFPDTEWCEEC
jgi:hypothetical protein